MSEAKEGLLSDCVGRSRSLKDLIAYSEGSIVSKTIVDKSVGTITLFAFEKGQRLSEHTAPYDAVVEVVEGAAEIRIGGEPVDVGAGQIVIMPADVPHSVAARERFKMVLTMIRA